jgi:superfamily I DNA and RNA helicase
MEIVVTTNRWKSDPNSRQLVEHLQANAQNLSLQNAIVYYDFPSYADYEASSFRPDLLIFSPNLGFIAARFYDKTLFKRSSEGLEELDLALEDFVGNLHSRLVRSRSLRDSRTTTIVPIHSLILAFEDAPTDGELAEVESDFCSSIQSFDKFLKEKQSVALSADAVSEIRSVVEGAKALMRSTKRRVEDDAQKPLARILRDMESQIANFDEKQRHIALVDVGGPARIRGLAGSGKTVILAMKAGPVAL